MKRLTIVVSVVAVSVLAFVSAFGADKTTAKGMIIARTGETLILSNAGEKTTVVLDDSTKVQDKRGALGIRKKQYSATVLIPGLKVSVDGTTDANGQLVAKTINFDGDDLETAQMIQAGLHPTAEQVAANQQNIGTNKGNIEANKGNIEANKGNIEANKGNIAANKQQIEENIADIESNTKRFSDLGEYDVKGKGTLNFKVGSSKIAPEDQTRLADLATKAKDQTGYIIEVQGYADAQGSAAMNTTLSQARATAVVDYLVQHGVPIRHIVAPGAMGETGAIASNETAAGRADNRRVEVTVLINKGIAGK